MHAQSHHSNKLSVTLMLLWLSAKLIYTHQNYVLKYLIGCMQITHNGSIVNNEQITEIQLKILPLRMTSTVYNNNASMSACEAPGTVMQEH